MEKPPSPDSNAARVDAEPAPVSRRMLLGGAAVSGLGLAATAINAVLPENAEAQTIGACVFALQIDGFFTGYFSHVSGLGSETVMNEVGDSFIQRIPATLKWSNITLKRGVTSNLDLYDWRKMVEDGMIKEARKDGTIVLYDQTDTELSRWNFEAGWPSKIEVQSGAAGEAACAWELITLSVDSVKRASPIR